VVTVVTVVTVVPPVVPVVASVLRRHGGRGEQDSGHHQDADGFLHR
jgi:hypothetical protein